MTAQGLQSAPYGAPDDGPDGRTNGRSASGAIAANAAQTALDAERSRFFLWVPVCLGAGIAAYFALPREPDLLSATLPLVCALILKALCRRGTLVAALITALSLAAAGFALAKVRVETVRAPVLTKPLRNVEVAGMLTRIEQRPPRGARLTIAVETLGTLSADQRPRTVRVRTMSTPPPMSAGDRIRIKASLSPPARPALPGGFDYARTAWFEGLGAVGYAFAKPVVETAVPDSAWRGTGSRAIEALRQAIGARIKAALPGEPGAIATALITGERGGITDATNAAYKNSGLFHILSISGLHMVIMAGAVFFSIRLLLAAVPSIALRFPIKKWAAVAGIIAALGYLAISGGAFATVRSAVMIVVIFTAVLLDRPALALRNVALSALLILAIFPESLFDAGFQMSFAAVTGLVATYEEVRRRAQRSSEPHPVVRILMFFGGIVFSTLVASAAVAPFAAYHFHQSQQYAVLANLLAIPVCNLVVMPAALAALLLMPLGLEWAALWVMGAGIGIMTWCANLVATLPGAVGHIPAFPAVAFGLMIGGGLWLSLWHTRMRLLGAGAALAGLALAPFMPRPDVLIARSGELVAMRGADGQLSALPARQAKFELERWLEHDGDARPSASVQKAAGFACDGAGCTADVKGVTLAVARHAAAVRDDCARAGIVVLNVPRPASCDGPQAIVDVFDVWNFGTHAVYIEEPRDGGPPLIRIETVAARRGERPWSVLPIRPLARPVVAPAIAPLIAQPGSAADRRPQAYKSPQRSLELPPTQSAAAPAPEAEEPVPEAKVPVPEAAARADPEQPEPGSSPDADPGEQPETPDQ